jgi:hypothetical protein
MNDTHKAMAHPKASNLSVQPPVEQTSAKSSIPPPGVIKRLPVRHMLDAAMARTTARKLAEQFGYDLIDQLRLAAATFELTQLLLTNADKGELVMLWYENTQGMGLKCYCCAEPPPIYLTDDKTSTQKPDFSRLKKLVDEFEYIEDPRRGDNASSKNGAPSRDGVAITVWLKHGTKLEI